MCEVREKCSDSIRATSKILTICQKSLHFPSSLLQDSWDNKQHPSFTQTGKQFFPQSPQNVVSCPPHPEMNICKHRSSLLEEITYPIKFCLLVLLEKASLQLPRLQICLLDLAPALPLTYVRIQPTAFGCMSLKLQLV